MTPTVPRLAAVLFVSGFCSLVYQVAWLRLLRLVFGASTASTAVVLAIFMGGLGVGGVILGRRAERVRNPLDFYSKLELGIGLAAAASPILVLLVQALYIGLGGVGTMGLTGGTILRILLAAVVLGVPTTLMGGTLPAVAQALQRDDDRGRRLIAGLYGVNTAGAVVGAFATTFILIELLGVRQTLWLVAAVNLLLGMVVRRMASHPVEIDPVEIDADAPAESSEPEAKSKEFEPAEPAAPLSLVLVAAGLVGLIFFMMELVWYRMLAPILGGSSYTFGLILVVALVGIASGSALYGMGGRDRRPTLLSLAWTCVLEAVCMALPFAAGDNLALFAALLRDLSVTGFWGLVLGWTVVVFIVVLLPAVVAGYQFPLLVALLGRGREHVGSQVGLAYGWNTFGAILGSLAGGFVLLPALSAPWLWRASVVALVLLAVVILAVAVVQKTPANATRRGLLPLLCGALALWLLASSGPTAFWRHLPIGGGRMKDRFANTNEWLHKLNEVRRGVVAEAEGMESSVALVRHNELSLHVNGKSDGASRTDGPTVVWAGLVAAALHPEPRQVLTIGLGSGTTTGWLAQIPTVERADVVELEPAVIDFSRAYDPLSFGASELEKVRVTAGDGREHVLTSKEKYDVIMSEPSNPYRAGVADFYSSDFYGAVAERLTPNGILSQWLQGYEIDAQVVQIAFASLQSVFPHVETWLVNESDLLLLASKQPIVHDFDRLRQRLETEPYRSALAKTWLVDGIEGFYSGFIGTPDLTRMLASLNGDQVSTDDRPLIEFGFARNVGRTGLFQVTELQRASRRLGSHRPNGTGQPLNEALLREARHVRVMADAFEDAGDVQVYGAEAARRRARAAWRDGDLGAAGEAWRSQDEPARYLYDRLLVAETLAVANLPGAEEALAAVADAPTEATIIAAELAFARGDLALATDQLEAAYLAMREDGWVFRDLAARAMRMAGTVASRDARQGRRLLDALAEPFAVYLYEEARLVIRVNLSGRIDFEETCIDVFADVEPHVLWEEPFLEGRLKCYTANNDPRAVQAERDLATFRANAAPSL